MLSNSSDTSHSQETDEGRLYGMGRKGQKAEGKGSSLMRTGSLESKGFIGEEGAKRAVLFMNGLYDLEKGLYRIGVGRKLGIGQHTDGYRVQYCKVRV